MERTSTAAVARSRWAYSTPPPSVVTVQSVAANANDLPIGIAFNAPWARVRARVDTATPVAKFPAANSVAALTVQLARLAGTRAVASWAIAKASPALDRA